MKAVRLSDKYVKHEIVHEDGSVDDEIEIYLKDAWKVIENSFIKIKAYFKNYKNNYIKDQSKIKFFLIYLYLIIFFIFFSELETSLWKDL
jgi:hypothetical protein